MPLLVGDMGMNLAPTRPGAVGWLPPRLNKSTQGESRTWAAVLAPAEFAMPQASRARTVSTCSSCRVTAGRWPCHRSSCLMRGRTAEAHGLVDRPDHDGARPSDCPTQSLVWIANHGIQPLLVVRKRSLSRIQIVRKPGPWPTIRRVNPAYHRRPTWRCSPRCQRADDTVRPECLAAGQS